MKASFKICFITILSLLSLNTFADNLAGNYQCTRTDPSNNTTTYPLTITSTDETYTLQWSDSSGNPVIYGTGVVSPSINNALSVVFWDVKNPSNFGDALYSIKPDGSLNGVWIVQSTTQTGTETCQKK